MSLKKPQLRRIIAETLKSLSADEKKRQSELVVDKLFNHPKYKAARNISLYLSTSQEIDTENILRKALEVDNKRCFIPFINKQSRRKIIAEQEVSPSGGGSGPDVKLDDDVHSVAPPTTRMTMVRIDSMVEYNELPLNKYGIKEPAQGVESGLEPMATREAKPERTDLDLVIVPGVAFSLDGRRLGHGKGYYDEFLTYWSQKSPTRLYTIGLAFREQIVDDPLASDEHDYTLDEVLFADN